MYKNNFVKIISFLAFIMSAQSFALEGSPNCTEPDRGYEVGRIIKNSVNVGPTIHFDGYSMLNLYQDQEYINRSLKTTNNGGAGLNGYDLKIFAMQENENVLLFIFADDSTREQGYKMLPSYCEPSFTDVKRGHFMITRRPINSIFPLNITANGGNGSNGGIDYITNIRGQGGNAGSGGNIELIYANPELIQNINFISQPGKFGLGGKGEKGFLAKLMGTTSGENGKAGVRGTISLKRVEPTEIDALLSEQINAFSKQHPTEYIYSFDSNYSLDLL